MNQDKHQDWFSERRHHLENLRAEILFPLIIKGDRQALARSITLIESLHPEQRKEAEKLVALCLPHSGSSWRIGITGVPGVGKSTFIEAIGQSLVSKGKKLAVMAIDPSSSVSGGSILGDKTRMEALSMLDNVYIRPTATGKTLGGVAQNTRETVILCEAAGFDVIIIETVGVGQSETLVHSMVDFFLLLMLAGAGDELQGIKRGIMEMADGILITKADQGNEKAAQIAKRSYANALYLFSAKESNWIPKVDCISSLEGKTFEKPLIWWETYFEDMNTSGYLKAKRKSQDLEFFEESFHQNLAQYISRNEAIQKKYVSLKEAVLSGQQSPYEAANHLVELITQTHDRI